VIDPGVLAVLARECGDTGFLDSYGEVDLGTARPWNVDFLTRFFAPERALAVPPSVSPI
jgi:hypothetical protein